MARLVAHRALLHHRLPQLKISGQIQIFPSPCKAEPEQTSQLAQLSSSLAWFDRIAFAFIYWDSITVEICSHFQAASMSTQSKVNHRERPCESAMLCNGIQTGEEQGCLIPSIFCHVPCGLPDTKQWNGCDKPFIVSFQSYRDPGVTRPRDPILPTINNYLSSEPFNSRTTYEDEYYKKKV